MSETRLIINSHDYRDILAILKREHPDKSEDQLITELDKIVIVQSAVRSG